MTQFGMEILDGAGLSSLPVTSESFVFDKLVISNNRTAVKLGIKDNSFTPIIFTSYFRSHAEPAGDGGLILKWVDGDWEITTPYCELNCYIFIPAKVKNKQNSQTWGAIIYNEEGNEMLISGTRPLIIYYDRTIDQKLPFTNCACSPAYLGRAFQPIGISGVWGLYLITATVRDGYIRGMRYVTSTASGGSDKQEPEYIPYINVDNYI
ncbi:hypothetical protein [Vibrio phage vB_VibM_83AMN]|nr:hypothetical protein [Vibrio phage vB_VibM_83AMN]